MKILQYFKKNRTRWYPFAKSSIGYCDHITFIKKDLDSGMLYFKTKKANKKFDTTINNILPNGMIDTLAVWKMVDDL